MRMKKEKRNPFDSETAIHWSGTFLLGITVPMAAQVIQCWLSNETPRVVASLGSTVQHGGKIRVTTKPPTATLPWKLHYRSVGAQMGVLDEFLTAPEDAYWFGDMSGVIAPGEVVRGDGFSAFSPTSDDPPEVR